jgi:hypothetical protein
MVTRPHTLIRIPILLHMLIIHMHIPLIINPLEMPLLSSNPDNSNNREAAVPRLSNYLIKHFIRLAVSVTK